MNYNNKSVVLIANLIFSVLVVVAIYYFVYSKIQKDFNERKVVYSRFYNINTQLDDFATIQRNVDEQKDKILETISSYEDLFISNEEIISAYKIKITEMLNGEGIPVKEDSITQLQKDDNNISLLLKLKASYGQICRFLFEIEQFSSVSNITINYLGEVSMECSPVIYSSAVNDFFSGRKIQFVDDMSRVGYFKEVSEKIFSVMDVGHIYTLRDFYPVPDSPFIAGFVFKKNVVKTDRTKTKYYNAPKIILDGVMYEDKNPIAIIDGKLYTKGSKYKNATIVKINPSSINVEYYDRIYTIKMEN